MRVKISYLNPPGNVDPFDVIIPAVQSITQVGEKDVETNTFGNAPVRHRHVEVEILSLDDRD